MCFERSYTRRTEAPAKVEVPVKTEVPVKAEVPVKTGFKTEFKVGDRVKVTKSRGGSYRDIPATITNKDTEGFTIKTDSGTTGWFIAASLELIPATPPVPVHPFKVRTGSDTATSVGPYQLALRAALAIATTKGFVTADEIQAELAKHGYKSTDLGNAAGSVFRSSRFRKIGETRSTRPSNHGRKIARWALATV